MEGSLPQLALVAVLILINAVLAGSELALVSLREGQLRRLEARRGAGQTLARLARDPNRFWPPSRSASPWPASWPPPPPRCRWPRTTVTC